MDENLHNIEDLFRSALDDNEEIASAKVWEAVDKRLDKDNIVSIKRKYTNLKRLAIMLVFLFASFALYDVYRINTNHKNGGLAKNNDTINSGKQNRPDKAADKILDKKTDAIASTSPKRNTTLVTDTANDVTDNSATKDVNITDQQKLQLSNTSILQKQNNSKVNNPETNIRENQTVVAAKQRKKSDTKSATRVKIKNATPVEDEQLLVQDNDEQQDNEITGLRKSNNVSIENAKLLPHDSIDTKQLSKLLAVTKIKITDTSNNSVAKRAPEKNTKPSRFSITPFFSPDIAWYRLQDDKVGNQQDNAREIEKEEKHEFSSTYGALVDYKLNKHWGLQSGLTLSNTNITVEPKTIYAQQDNTGSVKYRINTSSGYSYVLPSFSSNPVIGDSLYAFTSTHSLQYIGIPLAVTYNVSKGKFSFNAFAGAAANILTKAKLETTLEKGFNNEMEKVDNLQGLNKMYFSGLAGAGVNYKLTNKTSLVFAPTMRFALNSINKDATVKSYPMSFGFTMGLKIGL